MYNLNVNLASSANVNISLMVESACTTPRTPEILNSLIAMTNPLDNYNFCQSNTISKIASHNNNNNNNNNNRPLTNMSSDSNSSSSSQFESPTTNNPPSVQQTCSQLIKAGLKLSIEQKRKHQSDGEDLLDLDKCSSKRVKKNECSESEEDKQKQDGMQNWTWYENDDYSKLTPEDEERRRRRRERNKIAATKCRLKKREKTANLVSESETLETQNIDLKNQMQELQKQKRSLVEMLTLHRPHCQNNIRPTASASHDSYSRLPPVGSVIENHHHSNHSYSNSRPASVDPNYRTQQQNNLEYHRPASVGVISTNPVSYNSRSNNMNNYAMKTPSIIVEEASDSYQPQLTNLDNANSFHYNNQCHNNYSNQNYNTASGMDNGCMA